MHNTENLNLKMPTQKEFYNIEDFNENFHKIDIFAGRKDNPHDVNAEQIGAAKIQTGSYTGTGDKTVSLTFDFNPKLVIILSSDYNMTNYMLLIRDCNSARPIQTAFQDPTSYSDCFHSTVDWSIEKTVSWTFIDTTTKISLINIINLEYHYIAIG